MENMIDDKKIQDQIKDLEIQAPDLPDPAHYRAAAHLRASGAKNDQIAIMLGLRITEVKNILSLDRVQDMVYKIQKEAFKADEQKIFKALLPDAIDTARHVMLDAAQKGSTRLSASFGIMDRALGRPQQKIEVGGSIIKEVFERLDSLDQKSEDAAIEAEAKTLDNDDVEDAEIEETNDIDRWVKENI
jgi:hypothetical protein